MSKMTKRWLSIVTTLAVAFVMSFGCMSVAFAADDSFTVSGAIKDGTKTMTMDQFKAAAKDYAKQVTFTTLNNAGFTDTVEVEGITYEDFAKIFGLSENAIQVKFTPSDNPEKFQKYSVDELAVPDMNGNVPMITWYKKSSKGEDITLGTAIGQKDAGDINNSKWAKMIVSVEVSTGLIARGNGIESEEICLTDDFVKDMEPFAKTVTFDKLKNEATETEKSTVVGVDYETFAAHFGTSKYVYGVQFIPSDNPERGHQFSPAELKTPDMNGNAPLIIWNKDGKAMDVIGTAIGQKDATDANNSKWVKGTKYVEFKKLVKPSIKVTAGNKKVTVKVTKQNSDYTAFQISKATKSSKTSIVASKVTKKSKTISAKKGKTYYYKVRAIFKDDYGTVYGPWSTAKKCKAK